MKNILVIGSINMDLTIQVDRIPRAGETLKGYGLAANPGGKGANQAAAMAKLGAPVRMLGAVGRDEYGARLRASLSSCGVDCSAVANADAHTGLAFITVCRGDNCIVIDSGANGAVLPETIRQHAALLDWADILVLQLEIPLETVAYAAKAAKAAGTFVILNPAPAGQTLPETLLRHVDLLIPNEHEASLLLGGKPVSAENAQTAARELYEAYNSGVIITLGGKGCVYYDGSALLCQPAAAVAAVDTTAAGDSFIGGLCCAIAADAPMEKAVRYATAVSSVTVTRHGALPSLPAKAEADAAFERMFGSAAKHMN